MNETTIYTQSYTESYNAPQLNGKVTLVEECTWNKEAHTFSSVFTVTVEPAPIMEKKATIRTYKTERGAEAYFDKMADRLYNRTYTVSKQ